jgi:hypothetical protein
VAARVRKCSNADPGGNTKQEKEHNGMINVSVVPGAVYLWVLEFFFVYLSICTGNILHL